MDEVNSKTSLFSWVEIFIGAIFVGVILVGAIFYMGTTNMHSITTPQLELVEQMLDKNCPTPELKQFVKDQLQPNEVFSATDFLTFERKCNEAKTDLLIERLKNK